MQSNTKKEQRGSAYFYTASNPAENVIEHAVRQKAPTSFKMTVVRGILFAKANQLRSQSNQLAVQKT
jgi:hypothetical protein